MYCEKGSISCAGTCRVHRRVHRRVHWPVPGTRGRHTQCATVHGVEYDKSRLPLRGRYGSGTPGAPAALTPRHLDGQTRPAPGRPPGSPIRAETSFPPRAGRSPGNLDGNHTICRVPPPRPIGDLVPGCPRGHNSPSRASSEQEHTPPRTITWLTHPLRDNASWRSSSFSAGAESRMGSPIAPAVKQERGEGREERVVSCQRLLCLADPLGRDQLALSLDQVSSPH